MEGSAGSNVVIVTGTYYRGETESEKVRAALALDTIRRATELRYPIIVLDGGSTDDLVMSFQTAGAKVIQEKTKTYGESRRAALRAAKEFDRELIVWMEPEKVSFVTEISKLLPVFLEDRADIVIPERRSLSSYPTIQQYAEAFGNAYFRELTGQHLDVWFGPRVFRKELVSYFLDYDGKYGDLWDAIILPLLPMIKDGKRFSSIIVDYVHPKEQTAVEEHDLHFYDKRLAQLNNLIPALKDYWK